MVAADRCAANRSAIRVHHITRAILGNPHDRAGIVRAHVGVPLGCNRTVAGPRALEWFRRGRSAVSGESSLTAESSQDVAERLLGALGGLLAPRCVLRCLLLLSCFFLRLTLLLGLSLSKPVALVL